jgi:hypothetical protein
VFSRSLTALSAVIQSSREKVFEFVASELLGADDAKFADDHNMEERTAQICCGVKLLTAMLSSEEELRQMGIGSDENSADSSAVAASTAYSDAEPSIEFTQLIDVLFDSLSTGGETLAQSRIDDLASRAVVFETVTHCALSLTKVKQFGLRLSTDNWHKLGWALLSQPPSTAKVLLQYFGSILCTHPVHSKFLAYPCLFAAKDSHLSEQASRMVMFAVRRLRNTHEQLCSRAITAEGDEETGELKRLAENSMPENILPYLLHILSYHPDFPTSSAVDTEEDKIKLQGVVACVKMLLKILHESLSEGASNVSYLLKQLNLINQRYIDKHDNENIGLQFVTRVAAKLTNELVKTADNAQVYPGDILLPGDLYQLKPRRTAAQQSQLQGQQHEQDLLVSLSAAGMEEAELAIEKALHAKGGNNRHHYHHSSAATAGGGGVSRSSRAENAIVSPSARQQPRKTSPPASIEVVSGITDRRRVSSASEVAGKKQPSREIVPEFVGPAPTRTMPSRAAKDAVALSGVYREISESDREVAQWEQGVVESVGAGGGSGGKGTTTTTTTSVAAAAAAAARSSLPSHISGDSGIRDDRDAHKARTSGFSGAYKANTESELLDEKKRKLSAPPEHLLEESDNLQTTKSRKVENKVDSGLNSRSNSSRGRSLLPMDNRVVTGNLVGKEVAANAVFEKKPLPKGQNAGIITEEELHSSTLFSEGGGGGRGGAKARSSSRNSATNNASQRHSMTDTVEETASARTATNRGTKRPLRA